MAANIESMFPVKEKRGMDQEEMTGWMYLKGKIWN